MFITFNFNFIDKTVLTSASVYGLTTDIVIPPLEMQLEMFADQYN